MTFKQTVVRFVNNHTCSGVACIVFGMFLSFSCSSRINFSRGEFPESWSKVIRGQDAPFFQQYQWCFSHPAIGVPAGGVKVFHPKQPGVIYYHTYQKTMEAIQQRTDRPGLWKSEDSGNTWQMLPTGIRDFEWLFIHPYTNVLYAVVLEYPFFRLPSGNLLSSSQSRIVVSGDGVEWKDISPPTVYGHYGPLFVDPVCSNRICAFVSHHTNGVVQARDDQYREWRFFTDDEWERTHQGWDWKKFHTSLSVSGIVEIEGVFVGPSDGAIGK